MLKASFGFANKNMKPSKKNDILIKKKSVKRCCPSLNSLVDALVRPTNHLFGSIVSLPNRLILAVYPAFVSPKITREHILLISR